MKRGFLNKLIAVTIISTTLITMSPIKVSAEWIKDSQNNWKYSDWYGSVIGWKQINGLWYYFNSNGIMQTGVIQVSGKIYLLSESGVMQTGDAIIDGKLYKFDLSGVITGSNVPMPTKGFDAMGNSTIPYVPNQIINKYDDNSSPTNPNSGSVISDKVKEYTLTYKDDDGYKIKSKTVEKGESITLYEPEKDGYTFVEWNTSKNGNGTSYDEGDKIKITGDMILYAKWEEDKESGNTGNTDNTDKTVLISEIIIGSQNDVNTITTKSGTLQLKANILPVDAANKKVTWSIVSGTGQATISENGLLTAVADGKITVKATAKDGSNASGTKTIIITGQSSSGETESPDPEKLLNITKVTYNVDANTIDVTFDKSVLGISANGTTEATGALLSSNYSISGTAGLEGNPESVQLDETKKIVTLKLKNDLKGKAKKGGTIVVTASNIIGTAEEVLKKATGQYTVPASNIAALESLGYEFLGENSGTDSSMDNILSDDTVTFSQEVNQSIKVKIKASAMLDTESSLGKPTISYKVGSGSYKTLTTQEVELPGQLSKELTGETFIDLIDKGVTNVNVKVTAEDGKTNKIYTIKFNRAKSNKKDVTSFKFKNTSPIIIGEIDESSKIKTISALVDNDANMDLVSEYVISPGAIVKIGDELQVSGETQNTFVNKKATIYTVVAEDGSEKNYEVIITQKDLETIKQININGLNPPVAGEKPTNIVMEYGKYTAKVRWIAISDDPETVLADGEVFKPNTKYVAEVEVSAKSGCNFDSYYQPNLQNYTDSGILVDNGSVVDKDGLNKAIEPLVDRKTIEFRVDYAKTGKQKLKQPSVTLSDTGIATWTNSDDKASKYFVQLYKNNIKIGASIPVPITSVGIDMKYNVLDSMRVNGEGNYTVGITAIGDEINYTNSNEVISLPQKIAKLQAVSVAQWDGNIARFNKLGNQINVDKYKIKLFKDNLELGDIQEIGINDLPEKDFTTEISKFGNGKYKFSVTVTSKNGLFIDSNEIYSKEFIKVQ